MNILITGGGTGGHLSVANNIAHALKTLGNHELYYIGSTRGQDRFWFEDSKCFIKSYFLSSEGVVNKNLITLPKALLQQAKATKEALTLLKTHHIERVFSVGGYSAAPASLAALMLGLPLFIHEQNACLGSLNRLLKPFCKAFYSSYEENSPLKDYPIREEFFATQRIRDEVKSVLFLGGSQGALAINNLALELAKILQERGIHIIHQSGERDYERVRAEYEKLGVSVELFAFCKDLVPYMQRADFAISRAGASSLWELSANALPSLFIPYPYAAKNHQYYNAKFLVERHLAYLQTEQELDVASIISILDDSQAIKACSMGLKDLIKQGGARAIALAILGE